MATDSVEIANLALAHIGGGEVRDLENEDSTEARAIKRVYNQTVLDVAGDHKWNCLKARTVAAQLAVTPIGDGWEYQYELPADYVQMVSINGKDVERNSQFYEVEGRRLLTNEEEANIRYIKYQPDVTQWSPWYVQCVALLLGSRIAVPIRQDSGKAVDLKKEYYDVVLPAMRNKDAGEQRRKPIDTTKGSQYIKARRVSTNG